MVLCLILNTATENIELGTLYISPKQLIKRMLGTCEQIS